MIQYEIGRMTPTEYVTRRKRRKGKPSIEYVNLPGAFDIETTSTTVNGEKISFMYEWTIGYGTDDTHIYYGRTYESLIQALDEVSRLFDLGESRRMIIYVHNLGYEFQFLHKYLKVVNVFAVDERKPLKVELSNGIILQDSYILSGCSLDRTAKGLQQHKIEKLKDDFDYNLIRHQETPLTDLELKYCEHDVLILLYYIQEQIEQYNDNILSIPMTNTGRVRKYVKNHCLYGGQGKHKKLTTYKKIMKKLTIEVDEYKLLKRAFMGGFTHANAMKAGDLINDVSSIDFNSSYPAVMCSEKYPMSKGKKVDVSKLTLKKFKKILDTTLSVFTIVLTDLQSICPYDTYISVSKCRNKEGVEEDNGRVYKAKRVELSITNIDYLIIDKTYEYSNIAILEMYTYKPHYLPQRFIESVLSLYEDKTTLKGVQGKEQEYGLKKSMLNSTYGMTVTDIVRNETIYDPDNTQWEKEPANHSQALEDYNEKFDRVLYYPWGVFITAYARANLWSGILNIGDDYIYSDTDSIKFTNLEKHQGFIKAYNQHCTNKLKKVSQFYNISFNRFSPQTIKGDHKTLGVWDYEGTYTKFKTLGAKRYMYTFDNNEIYITIAGLSKKEGAKYIQAQSETIEGRFDFFNNNMSIPEDMTGKLTHTYIDTEMKAGIKDYKGNFCVVTPKSGIYLGGCPFHMSLSDKYLSHLERLSQGFLTDIKY